MSRPSDASEGLIQDWSSVALEDHVKEELKRAGIRACAADCLVNQFGFERPEDLSFITNEQLDALTDAIKQIQVNKIKRLKQKGMSFAPEEPAGTPDPDPIRSLKPLASLRIIESQAKAVTDKDKIKALEDQDKRGNRLDVSQILALLAEDVQFEFQVSMGDG